MPLERFFWFIFAVVMGINVFFWRRRLLIAVDHGRATRAEVDSFVRWLGTWFVGGGIALGVTELAAGWSSPFCAAVAPPGSIPHVVISVIEAAAWVMLLLWVWRGKGADFLARVAPALERSPNYEKTYPPQYVRAFVTILVVAILASRIAAERTMSRTVTPASCTISPASE